MLKTIVRPLSEGCKARSPDNANETRKSCGQSEDFFSNSANSRRSVRFARQQRPDCAYRNAERSGCIGVTELFFFGLFDANEAASDDRFVVGILVGAGVRREIAFEVRQF